MVKKFEIEDEQITIEISDIQRDADHAMYHAKMEGRNRVSTLNMPCYVEQKMSKED